VNLEITEIRPAWHIRVKAVLEREILPLSWSNMHAKRTTCWSKQKLPWST